MAEITIIPAKDRSDEIVRTAAYARVSSDSEDQLNSFAAQIRYYTELLKDSTDAVFVDMYADRGISGTSAAKRTEFQRMMSDCRKGKIDRILTKSISRFARNTKDSLEVVRELKTLGISVYYVMGTHEPIVEKSIFDSAQKIYAKRDKTNGLVREHSPFSTKIKCGNCGSTFRRKDRKTYVCWVCRKHDESADNCGIRQIRETEFQAAFIRLWNKLQAHGKAILAPMLRQLEALSEREKSGNMQLAELRKEISEIKQQTYLLTMLNSRGTLDGAYFKERTQELDRKLLTAQKQLHANLDDKDSERLDDLRKLIGIFERAKSMSDFDEIKFGQIVEKITALSESEIRFDLISGIGFTERIVR